MPAYWYGLPICARAYAIAARRARARRGDAAGIDADVGARRSNAAVRRRRSPARGCGLCAACGAGCAPARPRPAPAMRCVSILLREVADVGLRRAEQLLHLRVDLLDLRGARCRRRPGASARRPSASRDRWVWMLSCSSSTFSWSIMLVVGLGRGLAVLGARAELLHVGGVDAERVAAAGAHVEQRGAAAEPGAQLRGLCLRRRGDALLRRVAIWRFASATAFCAWRYCSSRTSAARCWPGSAPRAAGPAPVLDGEVGLRRGPGRRRRSSSRSGPDRAQGPGSGAGPARARHRGGG